MPMKLCAGLFFVLMFVSMSIGGASAEGQGTTRVAQLRFGLRGLRGREQGIAVWPLEATKDDALPIVIALHGRGEALLGPQRGYAAWVERYGLRKAYEAMLGGVLTPSVFGGLVRDSELAVLNAALRRQPYRGVLAVGIYTPDLLGVARRPEDVARYASWVAREVIPQVQRAFPFASTVPRQVGIDGVSLGGMLALEVGLRFPDVFGSVGSMQPAILGREVELAEMADRARRVQPQALRLMSSDDDALLPATRALSDALRARFVPHELVVTPGGHDYAFNRGPAAIELLRFHEQALHAVKP